MRDISRQTRMRKVVKRPALVTKGLFWGDLSAPGRPYAVTNATIKGDLTLPTRNGPKLQESLPPPCVTHTPDDDHDEGTASVVYNEWNVQTFGSLGAWEPGLLAWIIHENIHRNGLAADGRSCRFPEPTLDAKIGFTASSADQKDECTAKYGRTD